MEVNDIIWIGGSSVEATHLLDFETDTGSLGAMMGGGIPDRQIVWYLKW